MHKFSFWQVIVVIGLIVLISLPTAASSSPAVISGATNQQTDQLKLFQFGTPTSATRTGFAKVTVKDEFPPQKGYGFQSTQGLLAYDRGGAAIVRPKDEYTASVYGAYRTTSELTCALIEGTNDNAFVIALPDGGYTVWLIASDAESDPPLFEVWANNQKKLDVRIPRRTFVLMEPFQVQAAKGQLRIELRGQHGWVLNALIIGKDGAALSDVVRKVERDIFFLTEPELSKWKEARSTPVNPPLEFTVEEQKKGYVVFPADYTEAIVPAYVPARTAIGKPLTAFATPGEVEPATFCVSAQKELGKVAVELSDFIDENGRRISTNNVSVGIVRCWPQRASDWGGKGEYRIVPEMIESPAGRACHLNAGQLKQWWLTVHVPSDTPAGRYRMRLTVRPEKAPPTVLEWRLVVLPFQLTLPVDKHWGTWLDSFPPVGRLWGPERRGRAVPSEIERVAKADMADYRAHGFDLVMLNYYFGVKEGAGSTFTYNLSTLPQDMEYLKALGTSAPVVICFEYTCRNWEYQFAEPGKKHVPGTFSPKARQAIVGLVKHIHEEALRHHWPKIYYFPIDEPGNNKTENRYQFAENVLDFVHEVPGCETAVTVTAGCVRRLGEQRIDARIYAYGHFNRSKVLEEARQGHSFWYYDNGMFYAHSTLASRNMAGFEFLRSGAEVATAWGFAATQANPYNDFDGGHKDWNVIFPGVDKPTPTIYWELCREGVDDCRYVATLHNEIRRARGRSRTAEAQRAEKVLEPLLAAEAPHIANSLAFGRYRWRIAREILALRGDREQTLPFGAVAENPPKAVQLGPNLVANPSFEEPPQKDGAPPGRYSLGYPNGREKSGALSITDEAAHSGRVSLKWDLSKVAEAESRGRETRWLVVNVPFPSEIVKRLRGQRVKVGYWSRLGAGTAVPGLNLRQQLKDKPGPYLAYSGGVGDPAVWNHFETEGRLSPELESMDIHTWVAIPEADLASKSFFFMDDVSLQVIEEPPLTIATPLDEYYVGELIAWNVAASSFAGQVNVQLLSGNEVVAERRAQVEAGRIGGVFDSAKLSPGIYILKTSLTSAQGKDQAAEYRIILAPNIFDRWAN